MKKPLMIIGLIVITTIAAVGAFIFATGQRGIDLITRCETLQPGDPENKVTEVLGKPMIRRTEDYYGRKLTLLRFKVPSWFDTFPQVHLDEQSKAEYIVCHQNHRVGKNPARNSSGL